ncbi:hypothetical protein ACQPUY_02040 [Clostridium nigeriense]|uniref:hypothetical protein n=1 Tax=Clostridium nigeriense TaxID=1805470 RepID=UPI003D326026
MKIKNLFLKNKGTVISLIIALGIGFIGGIGNMSQEEYNSLINQNQNLESEIVLLDKQLTDIQDDVNTLQEKKEEAERIAKEEAEKKAKEEAEKKAQEERERLAQEEAERLAKEEAEIAAQNQQSSSTYVVSGNNNYNNNSVVSETPVGEMVWLSATGTKYHRINNCGNMNPNKARQVTRESAISQGFEACKKCY